MEFIENKKVQRIVPISLYQKESLHVQTLRKVIQGRTTAETCKVLLKRSFQEG